MSKNAILSKTIWLGIITAVSPLFPSFETFLVENPKTVMAGLGFLGMALRYFTDGKITLKP